VTNRRPFVIVGAGLAGAKAAQTLREEGYDGDVVLLGEEPERPYERPRFQGTIADRRFVGVSIWFTYKLCYLPPPLSGWT
jgi:cation diffusion facilitator CzcD-associated flavoprotein CzcO